MKKILTILLFVISSNHIHSQFQDVIVTYDPNTNLHLGSCTDYDKIFESKQDCMTQSESEWIDGGAVETNISTSFITRYSDISNNFNLSYHSDINSSLNLGDGYSGGGSMSIDYSLNHYFKNISNSIYFIVKAETSHGRVKKKNVSLKNEFKSLLNNNKFSDFVTQCGTHYVRFETRKSSAYAIISINNVESQIRNQIIAKYETSANLSASGFGSVNTNSKLDINNLFLETSKHGKVEITYLARGSEGIKTFSPIISSSSNYDINSILENLAKTLDGFDKEKSAPVEYLLASFKPFGLLDYQLEGDKFLFLEKTQANLNTLFDTNNELKEIKDRRHDDYLLYYKKYDSIITSKIKESVTKLKKCYNDNLCDISKIPYDKESIESIVFPAEVFDDLTVKLVPVYAKGITNDGEEKQVLTSLSVVVDGIIRHANYYREMTTLYMSDDLELFPTNGNQVGENNPSLGAITINSSNLKTKSFLLRLESFNLDIPINNEGQIPINNGLFLKHNRLLETLKSRNYFVNIKTTDNFFYNQKIKFNFSEANIKTIK